MTKKTEAEVEAELLGGDAFTEVAATAVLPEGVEAPPARLHPILSDEEVIAAQKEARTKVDKERIAAAKKGLIDAEVARLKAEEGVFSGDAVQDEMVRITLDLAPFTDRLVINGMVYMHGGTYPVTRARGNVLAEMSARGWAHYEETQGAKKENAYRSARGTMISPRLGVINAPQKAA